MRRQIFAMTSSIGTLLLGAALYDAYGARAVPVTLMCVGGLCTFLAGIACMPKIAGD